MSARLREIVVNVSPLGFISFGGPGVHVVLLRRLFVLEKEWLDATTFADLFSLSGALPGPGSTQLMFSIALVRGGAAAGVLAFLLWSLPGAIGMFLLALAVSHLPQVLPPLVLALLTGLNASAVGLIFYAGYQLACMTCTDKVTRLVLFGSAAVGSCYSAVWLFPVLTVLGGVITMVWDWAGWEDVGKKMEMAKRGKGKKQEGEVGRSDIALEELNYGVPATAASADDKVGSVGNGIAGAGTPKVQEDDISTTTRIPTPPPSPSPSNLRRRTAPTPIVPPPVDIAPIRTPINFHLSITESIIYVSLFFALLISILVVAGTITNPPRALKLFSNLLTAGTILFGGGPVVIPLLQGYTVDPGWVSTQDFLFGFAILQAFPGPNFNFAVFLGALSLPGNPVLGGILAFVAIFLPGLVLKMALLPTYAKFREYTRVRSALRGLNAAASGLVWTAVFRLWKAGLLTADSGTQSLEKSGYWASIAAGAFIASEFFRLQPYFTIISGALLGLIYGAIKGAP